MSVSKIQCSTSKCVDSTLSLSASFLLYCMCRTAGVKISALLYVKWDSFCIASWGNWWRKAVTLRICCLLMQALSSHCQTLFIKWCICHFEITKRFLIYQSLVLIIVYVLQIRQLCTVHNIWWWYQLYLYSEEFMYTVTLFTV